MAGNVNCSFPTSTVLHCFQTDNLFIAIVWNFYILTSQNLRDFFKKFINKFQVLTTLCQKTTVLLFYTLYSMKGKTSGTEVAFLTACLICSCHGQVLWCFNMVLRETVRRAPADKRIRSLRVLVKWSFISFLQTGAFNVLRSRTN